MTGDISLKQRVLDGAALLDQQQPGWAQKIDLKRFRIQSSQSCVLGHVYGDYGRGATMLGLDFTLDKDDVSHMNDLRNTRRLGFEAPHAGDADFHGESITLQEYDTLERYWREEIRARQEANA